MNVNREWSRNFRSEHCEFRARMQRNVDVDVEVVTTNQ